MANALTGQFDAVVEVRVEAVNRILATLHQNGGSQDASPSLPHSFAVRVGDVQLFSELALWGTGIIDVQDGGGSTKSSKAPLGVSQAAQQAAAQQSAAATTPAVVRGTAWVQVSTPRVSFPPASSSDVDAWLPIRAHYAPDPNTRVMPTPIHGDIRARFSIQHHAFLGKRWLSVKPTADDSQIVFQPAQGTSVSSGDRQRITEQIRVALRSRFEPTVVVLPEDFKFLRFKALGSGAAQVIALPLNLSGPAPPASALAGVTSPFVKPGAHFAVAVAREYVDGLFQPFLAQIYALHPSFTFSTWLVIIPIPWPQKVSVTYDVSISSAKLVWQTGSIKLVIEGSATTESVLPNYSFTVEQALTLALHAASQTVSIQAPSDPLIFGDVPSEAIGPATSAIIQHRDAALQQAQAAIQAGLTGGVTLDEAVKAFDGSATARYTSLEVRPAGVVLQGTVSTKARAPVVVQFGETADGSTFTALKTWIPAGTIEKLEWKWEKENPYFYVENSILEGAKKTEIVEDRHGFLLPIPEKLPPDGRLCLSVSGKQVPSSGGDAYPVFEEHCQLVWPVMRVVQPAAWDLALAAPIWRAADDDEATLESAIVAHVGVFTSSHTGSAPGANTIVHFAGSQWAKPLEALGRGIRERGRRDAPVAIVLVLPRGTFRGRRAAFTERLGSPGREFAGSVVLTEDYDSGWTKTFAVESGPATFVINSQGEVVWQQAGPLDVGSLTAALDEHTISGARPACRLQRLAVRPGDRAPDVLFEDARRERLPLRRFRGRQVLLTFWKSWSAPCLAELARLQRAQSQAGPDAPMMLAINDGEDPERVVEACREHRLTLTTVPDPDREIARRYGVSCWPTTIAIGETGIVDRVRFGVTPDRMPVGRGQLDARAQAGRRAPRSPGPRPKPKRGARSEAKR